MKSIEWSNKTWNPVYGECDHACEYCYMAPMKKRFPGTGKKYSGPPCVDLEVKVPRADVLFVCSANDVGTLDHDDVLKVVRVLEIAVRDGRVKHPIFLTKRPSSLVDVVFPKGSWVGTTVESLPYSPSKAPPPEKRLRDLGKVSCDHKWVSMEPAFSPTGLPELADLIVDSGAKIVVVGGLSGGFSEFRGHPVATETEIREMRDALEAKGVAVFRKENLKYESVLPATTFMWIGASL